MLLWSIVCQRLAGFGCKGQKERTDRSRCLPSYSITCKILLSIQNIKEQEQVYYTQHHSLKLMFDLTVVRFIKKYLKSFQNVPSCSRQSCQTFVFVTLTVNLPEPGIHLALKYYTFRNINNIQ